MTIGDQMNLFFIERYIQKIKKEDIYNYAQSQGLSLNKEELNILYNFLKTNYKIFFTNPDIRQKLLNELKSKVSYQTASKLEELYNQYKNKI